MASLRCRSVSVFLSLLGAVVVLQACEAPSAAPPMEERAAAEFYPSSGALPPDLPFSEAVRVGDLVILSGQVGVEPGSLDLVEGGVAAEARQTMENIRSVLEANGLSMKDVVKCTVMLDDISQWAAFNEVYSEFFEPPYPARSAFGADGLAIGAAVEVECQAAVR